MAARRRIGKVLGSIRTRLAVFFFLITAIAIAVVYIDVTPSLQAKLELQQLQDTHRLAGSVDASHTSDNLAYLASVESTERIKLADALQTLQHLKSPKAKLHLTPTQLTATRAKAQALYKARSQTLSATETVASGKLAALARRTGAADVTLLHFQYSANGSPQGTALLITASPGQPVVNAATTALTSRPRAAYLKTVNSGLGLVAVPVPGKSSNSVFVYSVTFADVHSDVLLIRHRILIAAAIALAVVLLLGILVARALTVRVLRLERAAQRVAAGDLTAQFEVDANDELGQLAAALAHMQRQLQELEEARRRFIATASHELRTPIFSLGGFLELIQDEELDEDTRRQFVGQVREQVARLGKLATGLLDLSRLEAGSVDLQPTPTDLGVLSRAVASEFVPALALHGSELDLDLPETPLRAVVDPDRVAQLLRILIDNAITHTPPGTAVTVAVANGDGRVRLSVADHGPGIPDAVLGRIFDPFYSADGVQGAGLGLAIARELAERLQGSLDVRSEGTATVFTLTLPGEDS
jgi:two-component system OmpR family sensor kinase